MTSSRTFANSAFALALALFSVACGGDSGPMDPGSDGGGRTVKANPSFSADVVEIFVRRGCTGGNCHGSGQGDLTLTASASTSWAGLVNVTSPASGEVRVIPGNAQDSYLVKKLEGRQSVGARMPLTGSALDATDLANVRNWIDQGALNN